MEKNFSLKRAQAMWSFTGSHLIRGDGAFSVITIAALFRPKLFETPNGIGLFSEPGLGLHEIGSIEHWQARIHTKFRKGVNNYCLACKIHKFRYSILFSLLAFLQPSWLENPSYLGIILLCPDCISHVLSIGEGDTTRIKSRPFHHRVTWG